MESVFLLVENERHEDELQHGIFMSLPEAIKAATVVNKLDADGVLSIKEQALGVLYQYQYSDPQVLYAGILARYDAAGKLLEDNRHRLATEHLGM